MSNNYFRFKQFTVHQELCAMKVCTDACLFGAWLSAKPFFPSTKHIMDIGAGTGLLSLIMAQKTIAMIDAVEMEESAAQQAKENFEVSPWKGQLTLIFNDIKELVIAPKYDLVISNPPFYTNDLKSDNNKKNLALHSEALNLNELLQTSLKALANEGRLALLLPAHRADEFEKMALTNGLYLEEKAGVKQTEKHSWFRVLLLFSSIPSDTIYTEIIIKDAYNNYTKEFSELLKDYYLFL